MFKLFKRIFRRCGCHSTWKIRSAINSPRLRYAGRPSLLRKEGEKKSKSLFPRSEERVVERSKDRVSKLHGGISNLPNTYGFVTNNTRAGT